MLTPQQFRAKAAEYGELVKRASNPGAIREFQELERSFIELANNPAWLASNLDKTSTRPKTIVPPTPGFPKNAMRAGPNCATRALFKTRSMFFAAWELRLSCGGTLCPKSCRKNFSTEPVPWATRRKRPY